MSTTKKKIVKEKYVTPKFKLVKHMTFMFDNIRDYKYSCRQCSSCHGCR